MKIAEKLLPPTLNLDELSFSETSLHFFPNEKRYVPENEMFVVTNVTGSNFRMISDAVQSGRNTQTFQRCLLSPSSTVTMRAAGCSEASEYSAKLHGVSSRIDQYFGLSLFLGA